MPRLLASRVVELGGQLSQEGGQLQEPRGY